MSGQTSTILRTEDYLAQVGLYVIYSDYPNASRSGSGLMGKVHLAFEHILDRHPDVVAYDLATRALLLFEVDSPSALTTILPYKADLYRASCVPLLRRLSTICKIPFQSMELVYVPIDFRAIDHTRAVPPMDRVLMADVNGELNMHPTHRE